MRAPATQFVILAGMLGSGKTSLLEALLAADDAVAGASAISAGSTALIVNEIGAINIDGAVLSESARGTTMATLSNGCVCCSLSDDLAETVEELVAVREAAGQPPFERIVLECSGLSQPGGVMRSLAQLAPFHFRIHIVATYDCSLPPLADNFEEAAAQLSAAHTIVLTKIDLVDADARRRARDVVTGVNPMARLVDAFALSVRAREAFAEVDNTLPAVLVDTIDSDARIDHDEDRGQYRAQSGADEGVDEGAGDTVSMRASPSDAALPSLAHPRVRVFRARLTRAAQWEDVLDWLENITGVTGSRLLRMKAIVAGISTTDRVLLQSVGTTFAAPRRLNAIHDQLAAVFIVRDCAMIELQQVDTPFEIAWTALQPLTPMPHSTVPS